MNKWCSLILLLGLRLTAQETVATLPLDLKKYGSVFEVTDAQKGEATLFFANKTSLKAVHLDPKFNLLDSLTLARPEKQYDAMIGSLWAGANPCLVWSSISHKKIALQRIDWSKRGASGIYFELAFDGEKYIESFSADDRFYLLTVLKKENALKLYVFDGDGHKDEKTVAVPGEFLFEGDKKTDLYGVLGDPYTAGEPPFSVQYMTPNDPAPMTTTGRKRKCYFDGKTLVLTFDHRTDYTQVISIDLQSFSARNEIFPMPSLEAGNFYGTNSNSFRAADGTLFQLRVSSDKMILTVRDAQNRLLATHEATDQGKIPFANSGIVQITDGKSKTIDDTAQFLRKANRLSTGVCAIDKGDRYWLSLGCASEESTPTMMMGVGIGVGGIAGAVVAVALSAALWQTFSAYSNRRVVVFNSIIDKNGQHLDGPVGRLAFDKMRNFLEDRKGMSIPTVFRMGDDYILGYYEKEQKSFSLRKFVND